MRILLFIFSIFFLACNPSIEESIENDSTTSTTMTTLAPTTTTTSTTTTTLAPTTTTSSITTTSTTTTSTTTTSTTTTSTTTTTLAPTTTTTSTTTTTLAPTTTTQLDSTCTAWKEASDNNRRNMEYNLQEYVSNYIKYQAGNLDLNNFVNLIVGQVNTATSILTNQRELVPNNDNEKANSDLITAFGEFGLALGYYKKGWTEQDSYYITLGDIYLETGYVSLDLFKIQRKGC
jgi:hypothetical protein